MYFELDTALLDAAQALCIALPAAGIPAVLARMRGRGWTLVAPLSVIGSVAAITLATASADGLAWLALLLVPLGCVLALGWAARCARPWMAVLALPLLAAALATPDDPLGQVGRLVLIVCSCVTVGRLLAGAASLVLLKAGVVAMAAIDAVFIFGEFFEEQNAQFDAAVPAAGLPRLQLAHLGDSSTDYGDYFVAGLVGGILAAERRPQAAAAVAMFAVAQAFNQLFLVVDSLPGTVPPALVMLAATRFAGRGRLPCRPAPVDQLQGFGRPLEREAGPDTRPHEPLVHQAVDGGAAPPVGGEGVGERSALSTNSGRRRRAPPRVRGSPRSG